MELGTNLEDTREAFHEAKAKEAREEQGEQVSFVQHLNLLHARVGIMHVHARESQTGRRAMREFSCTNSACR